MTFWLDAHLDPDLAAWLGATFKVIAKSLDEIGLRFAEEEVLFEAARRFNAIVIMTKDHDFIELVKKRGSPPQILCLNYGNMRTLRMQMKLRADFPNALERLEAGEPFIELF
jgi:predicted nuclease of predicted toxin-antitoxin system